MVAHAICIFHFSVIDKLMRLLQFFVLATQKKNTTYLLAGSDTSATY